MGALQDFLSWVDNTKRVTARNVGDLVSNPTDTIDMLASRAAQDTDKSLRDPEAVMDMVVPMGMLGTVGRAGRAASRFPSVDKPPLEFPSLFESYAPDVPPASVATARAAPVRIEQAAASNFNPLNPGRLGQGALRQLSRQHGVDDAVSTIGREFAGRDPAEFFRQYVNPARSLEDAKLQYGVEVGHGFGGGEFLFDNYSAIMNKPKKMLSGLDAMFDIGVRDTRGVAEYLKTLPDYTNIYEIDAMGSKKGSGKGSNIYPAMFDYLSGVRGMTNVPTALTPINQLRRSINTADALQRNPDLQGLIVPHDTQLRNIGMSPSRAMELSRPEHIGALNLASSLKQLDELDQLRNKAGRGMLAAKDLRGLEGAMQLSPTSSLEDFNRLGSGLTSYGMGPNSLRRMAITDALLSGDELNPELWRGLARRKGGSIP